MGGTVAIGKCGQQYFLLTRKSGQNRSLIILARSLWWLKCLFVYLLLFFSFCEEFSYIQFLDSGNLFIFFIFFLCSLRSPYFFFNHLLLILSKPIYERHIFALFFFFEAFRLHYVFAGGHVCLHWHKHSPPLVITSFNYLPPAQTLSPCQPWC